MAMRQTGSGTSIRAPAPDSRGAPVPMGGRLRVAAPRLLLVDERSGCIAPWNRGAASRVGDPHCRWG